MAPLATVDLVGWDVHKAIVDNVHANCEDEAHASFAMPAYMNAALHKGAWVTRRPSVAASTAARASKSSCSIRRPAGTRTTRKPRRFEFVEKMKQFHHVGRYGEALEVLAEAKGADADLCRRVVLGYVSYALNRVGEVAASPADVDTIMSFGFNWAPPTAIVDLLGAKHTVAMLQKLNLTVPAVVDQAAASGVRMFSGGILDYGRTFVG